MDNLSGLMMEWNAFLVTSYQNNPKHIINCLIKFKSIRDLSYMCVMDVSKEIKEDLSIKHWSKKISLPENEQRKIEKIITMIKLVSHN